MNFITPEIKKIVASAILPKKKRQELPKQQDVAEHVPDISNTSKKASLILLYARVYYHSL